MKRAILTLAALTLAASVAGTPREAPVPQSQEGGGYRGLHSSAINTLSAVLRGASACSPPGCASMPAYSGAVGTVLLGGTLSYVDAKYGPEYLALPFPRGTVAEICAVRCVTRRSTDFGPDQRVHPNRIADLSAADFVYVCGVPLSAGLCRGTVEIEPPVDEADDRMRVEDGGPAPTLPPTDVAP